MIDGFPAALYADGKNYIPEYDVSQISITEQFVPLISIDVVSRSETNTLNIL